MSNKNKKEVSIKCQHQIHVLAESRDIGLAVTSGQLRALRALIMSSGKDN